MTVLYSSNFDSTADGNAADFTLAAGAGLYIIAASSVSCTAVSGTKIIGRNSDGDAGYCTSVGSRADTAIRTDFVLNSLDDAVLQYVAHVIRGDSTFNIAYFFKLRGDSSNLAGQIVWYSGGTTVLATSAYSISATVGDVIHMESRAVGTTLELRIWVGAASRPSTATVSTTDSAIATGYAGLRKSGPFGWAATDNLVITDALGGEGFFDSTAATATTLSGPSSGTTGVASTNFTVGANGTITGTVTVTPGDAANGGTFTPTSVAISSGTPTATFTYTPASTGVKTISISDDGGLTDATSISYTSNAGGGSVRTPAFYQTFIAGR